MRRVGGQAQLDLVALQRADHGVGDAGIAAGGVEQGAVVGQPAGPLAIQDHVQPGAVFHRPAGIEELRLGVDFDARKLRIQLRQAQQRRVADLIQ